ncbi:MAG TPA: dihydrolipoyl dehydrogenase [Candidatus Omnitrophota bacterium]|nr:dihydrolipoyl dehydrogenase [Candidatus Omnitrophota bacterium]
MHDICIIGAGWAGYSAAIKAKELGLAVCLVEKKKIGGTCLNQGCIPTKVLVQSSRIFSHIKDSSVFGVEVEGAEVNFDKIQQRKSAIVDKLAKGMQFQLSSKGVEIIQGEAKIVSADEVLVDSKSIKAKNIIVAVGSRPVELPFLKFNQKNVVSSDDILDLKFIPESLLIVGGGVIGCEFANIFASLGSKVTIVEILEHILPNEDKDIAKKLELALKRKGVKILTKTDVKTVALDKFEKVLVCVGRAANTTIEGMEKIGVKIDKKGILVNEFLQTNIPNIYAVGDCIGGHQLAHVAAYEGETAVENISGKNIPVDYSAVPNCIFTDPEVASVGLTEEVAAAKGVQYQIAKFDFLGSGMAHILDETDGFIKVLFDSNSREILGAAIIGPKATELIAVFSLAIKSKLKISQINDTIFAHPTLSEAIREATKSI